MKPAVIYSPQALVETNENANGHTLTVQSAGQGNTKPVKGSIWRTILPQRHYYEPAGGAPTLAVGAAAGTGASIVGFGTGITLNDGLLPLKLTTGTGPSTGTIVTVTFHVAYPGQKLACFVSYADAISRPLQLCAPFAGSGTTLVVTNQVAPAASTVYQFVLKIIGLY